MLKKAIYHFDLFAASPTLRHKGQPEVANLCGGICSIAIILSFMAIFIFSALNLFNLVDIKSQQINTNYRPFSEQISSFRFAVGILDVDMSANQNIFSVFAKVIKKDAGGTVSQVSIPVVPCTIQMWDNIDEVSSAQTIQLSNYYCNQNTDLTIYGGFFEKQYQLIQFEILKCNNSTSSVTCQTSVNIDAFISNYINTLSIGNYVTAQFLALSTNLNLAEENPISKFIDLEAYWLPFTSSQSVEFLLTVGTYKITTDTSFLPWKTNQIIEGNFIDQKFVSFVNPPDTDVFMKGFILTSPFHRQIIREYGKIDDLLSYVGGLFGLLIVFFAFFMESFNQYRYELSIAENTLQFQSNDDDQKTIGAHNLHFLKYVKYSIYDWVKALTGCECWNDCKQIEEVREEGVSQIDVYFLLKRIGQLQQISKMGMSEEEQCIIGLSQNISLKKMKKRRSVLEYNKKIINNRATLTIMSISLVQATLNSTNAFKKANNEIELTSMKIGESFDERTKKSQPNLLSIENSTSEQILNHYLTKYQDYLKQFQENTPPITQDEKEVQSQLIQNFKKIDQNMKCKIILKIPLPILNRLHQFSSIKVVPKGQKKQQWT